MPLKNGIKFHWRIFRTDLKIGESNVKKILNCTLKNKHLKEKKKKMRKVKEV